MLGSRSDFNCFAVERLSKNMTNNVQLSVERIGGLGGFGLPGSHLKSKGQISTSELSAEDIRKLEAYFEGKLPTNTALKVADGFRYRITKKVGNDLKTIELPEALTPSAISGCVKDTLE
jgi:hypothetical protein